MTPTASVAAVQARFTWLDDAAVAPNPEGAVGGVVSLDNVAARKAAICMTQSPEEDIGAVAV